MHRIPSGIGIVLDMVMYQLSQQNKPDMSSEINNNNNKKKNKSKKERAPHKCHQTHNYVCNVFQPANARKHTWNVCLNEYSSTAPRTF